MALQRSYILALSFPIGFCIAKCTQTRSSSSTDTFHDPLGTSVCFCDSTPFLRYPGPCPGPYEHARRGDAETGVLFQLRSIMSSPQGVQRPGTTSTQMNESTSQSTTNRHSTSTHRHHLLAHHAPQTQHRIHTEHTTITNTIGGLPPTLTPSWHQLGKLFRAWPTSEPTFSNANLRNAFG